MKKLSPLPALKLHIFLYYASAIFVLGYFPLYFESIGFSKLQIGSIFAFGPAIGIFDNLFWGYISDKFQVIKKLLLLVIIMQFSLIMLLMHAYHYPVVIAIMLVMFFFQTSITPLTDSLTLLTTKAMGRSFAGLRSYGSFGFAITALLINPFIQKIGYHYTLIIYACVLFLVILAVTQLTERVGESKKVSFRGLFKIINNKEVLLVLGCIFLLAIAHRTNDNFLSLYLKEIGLENYLGYAYMISALSEIPVFIVLSKFGERFKSLHLLALAAFFYFIRFTIVAHVAHPIFIIFAQLMHSVTFGIFYITAIRYISSIVPNEYRSSGQALFTITFSGFASITSGILGGWVYEIGSGKLLYSSISICALLACGLFLYLQVRQSRLHP